MAKRKPATPKQIETHVHDEATRKNLPTAEMQPVVSEEMKKPIKVNYERRNRDLDPQLIWRGKYPNDDMDQEEDLVVNAPPLYIQEKVHPKVLIDDLVAQTKRRKTEEEEAEQLDMFGDFNGIPEGDAKTEFYQHDAHWSNRMILGDSLQVMASLAEREGLRGKVQCIYFDPPYGIKFNSNFQWSTNSTSVKDGKVNHITREPEQVKAFRDTWKDGVNSYLTHLKDRFIISRNLLDLSGSLFIQISDENVHLVRSILDEVFGSNNFVSQIIFQTTSGFETTTLSSIGDYVLWYAKDKDNVFVNSVFDEQDIELGKGNAKWIQFDDFKFRGLTAREKDKSIQVPPNTKLYKPGDLQSQNAANEDQTFPFQGKLYKPNKNAHWKANFPMGMNRLGKAGRIHVAKNSIQYIRYANDYPYVSLSNIWTDTRTGSFTDGKLYIVQTNNKVVQRCLHLATKPGDLVLDPTCGSGTTAYIAEQLGRRWITIDTSRVALALARARIMGARYPYYLLADSKDGQKMEAEITRSFPKDTPTYGNIRQGFVYERVPHITLKSIANNTEIDTIYDTFQERLEPLRTELNELLGTSWEEWEIPRTLPEKAKTASHRTQAENLLADWWKLRIARQREIDASIAAKADTEYLYDKPYEDKKKVRVAGPFTVESISPHRMLGVDENGDTFDQLAAEDPATYGVEHDFAQLILNNLEKSGVQQDKKSDRIKFDTLTPWPGSMIAAEGIYHEADGKRRRAAIHIGPEFGSVSRADLVDAAKEAADVGFDLLIACGFNYDAHSTEFTRLGKIPVLKARMNADLHMAQDLAATGSGNLFVVFGEPDIELRRTADEQLTVKVLGVDIFDPKTGKVRSDDVDGIACWFVDTDYNGESFFVRHAYFLGANDPYKSLKTTLKAEVDRDAWETLNSDISRPFAPPATGRIAVKIINHLGDEVMKVMRVD